MKPLPPKNAVFWLVFCVLLCFSTRASSEEAIPEPSSSEDHASEREGALAGEDERTPPLEQESSTDRDQESEAEGATESPAESPGVSEPSDSSRRSHVSVEAAFAAGVLAYVEESYEEAVAHLRQVLDNEPEHLRATHYLGLSLIALERYDDALDVLEPAASYNPEDVALQTDLGAVYILIQNEAFAVRTLGRVVDLDPDNGRARFLLGTALSQQGDCDLAARYLEEARHLGNEYGPRAQYLEGVCHAREGDIQAARLAFEPLARSPLDQPIADTARRFVRIALRSEGIETAPVSGMASSAVQYDSNPAFDPDGTAVSQAVGLVFQGNLTVRAVASEGHTLAGDVSFYRSFNFPGDHVADYNYTHVTASGYYQLRGRVGEARHQLQLGYDFGLGLYDGDVLTDANHLYSEMHGARVSWAVRETANLLTRATFILQYSKFALLRRNNVGFTSGLGQAFSIPRAGIQIYLEGTIRVEQASSYDYDVVAPGILLSVSAQLPWELFLTGWIQYEHEIHPASSEGRVDELINTTLSLEREIIEHLGLTLAWLHSEDISTVGSFDYGRDVVSLSIWGSL